MNVDLYKGLWAAHIPRSGSTPLHDVVQYDMTSHYSVPALCLLRHRHARASATVANPEYFYPPSERSENGGYTVFTFICLSVCVCVCAHSVQSSTVCVPLITHQPSPSCNPSPSQLISIPKPILADMCTVVDKGLSHSILPHRGGMTGQSAPTVLVCWSL